MRTLAIREMQERVNEIVGAAASWEEAQRMVDEDEEVDRLCREIIRDATARAWTAKVGREIDAMLRNARAELQGRTLAEYLNA